MGTRSRMLRPVALAVSAALVIAACGSDDDSSDDASVSDDGGDSSDAEGGGGGDSDLAGESVEIFGAYSGDEADLMRETLQPLIDATGIDVEYVDSPAFDTEITTRVEGGNLPDIAFFPQPGLLLDIADQTDATPVGEYLDISALEASLIPGFLDAATADDGNVYGFPVRMAVKSAMWRPLPAFDDGGYTVPTDDVELASLEDQILADGGTPWCLGMESGPATGWVGTDWVEEYMLRLHGPDVYDQWVTNELPFDSPEVRAAFEKFEELWDKDGNVVGGTAGVLGLSFGDVTADLFTEPANCYLHRQGNFITGFFPTEVQDELDDNVAVSYFPPVEGGFDGNPVLAGGDLALLIDDNPAARAVMEFLATDTYGAEWASAGGWLSPHVGFDDSLYPTQVERDLFQIGAQADVLRFDASDLMPGPVGTGSFWTGMVDWIGGQRSLDEVLVTIDESWPE
ncbi:MAG: ABC transporter substrate-binding protein [Actinomycetota bacterium]